MLALENEAVLLDLLSSYEADISFFGLAAASKEGYCGRSWVISPKYGLALIFFELF